jgi:hypothetical protein
MKYAHPLLDPRPELIDQPIYWPRFGDGRSIVDPLRPFTRSRNYKWRGYVFPDTKRSNVAGLGQVEDQMSITPGSFLLMISAQCTQPFPNDFRYTVTDKGSGVSISNDFVRYMAATGGVRLTTAGALFPNQGLPMILQSPLAIAAPGRLMIKIVNLYGNVQNIRLFLQFAEPRTVQGGAG